MESEKIFNKRSNRFHEHMLDELSYILMVSCNDATQKTSDDQIKKQNYTNEENAIKEFQKLCYGILAWKWTFLRFMIFLIKQVHTLMYNGIVYIA